MAGRRTGSGERLKSGKKQKGKRCLNHFGLLRSAKSGGLKMRDEREKVITERRMSAQMARMRSKMTGNAGWSA